MRVVVDTNVLISGVLFPGNPSKVLQAWRDGRFDLLASFEILEEYRRVIDRLSTKYPTIDLDSFLTLVVADAELIEAPSLWEPVCRDPDDDKFLACAAAGHARMIVSGDEDLLEVSGFGGIEVLRPRDFLRTLRT